MWLIAGVGRYGQAFGHLFDWQRKIVAILRAGRNCCMNKGFALICWIDCYVDQLLEWLSNLCGGGTEDCFHLILVSLHHVDYTNLVHVWTSALTMLAAAPLSSPVDSSSDELWLELSSSGTMVGLTLARKILSNSFSIVQGALPFITCALVEIDFSGDWTM